MEMCGLPPGREGVNERPSAGVAVPVLKREYVRGYLQAVGLIAASSGQLHKNLQLLSLDGRAFVQDDLSGHVTEFRSIPLARAAG